VYHFRGQKHFSGTINWQYCPIFSRIFHDYLYLNNNCRLFRFFAFLLAKIAQFFREYSTTTFIWTTTADFSAFLLFYWLKLHNFFANIPRLPLFEQQLRTFPLFCFFIGQYCPIFTRILHDYLYLNNKLRTFPLFCFFIGQYWSIFTRILHDYLYLNNKLRTFSLFYFPLYKHVRIFFRKNRQYFR
jgi:hypothetical protein